MMVASIIPFVMFVPQTFSISLIMQFGPIDP